MTHQSHRLYWGGIVLIVLAAALLRFTGYNFSLPYIDQPDEPNFSLAAQSTLDTGSSQPLHMQGYPPGIITLNYLLLRFFPDPTQPTTHVIGAIRLLSVLAGLGTVILVGMIARSIAGNAAGWIAAWVWAISPSAIDYARFATADMYMMLFSLAALYSALIGFERRRSGWLNSALIWCMLAVVFKYQAIFLLPLLVLLSVLRLIMPGANRSRIWENLVQQAIGLAVFFFWWIALYPTLEANEVPYWIAPTSQITFPSMAVLIEVMRSIIENVASSPLWIGALLGLAAWLIFALGRRTEGKQRLNSLIDPVALGVAAAAGFSWWVGISFFPSTHWHQYFALAGLLAVFIGIAWTGIAALLRGLLRRNARDSWIFPAITGAALIVSIPLAAIAVENAREHTLHDRRNDLAVYMDTSVPPAPFIATTDNHKTLNREWGGYDGVNVFPFVAAANIASQPLTEWQNQGVRYAIMSNAEYDALDSELRAALLPMKSYPPSNAYRGPDMIVTCLCQPAMPLDLQLGGLHWIGMDREQTTESLRVRYYWRADQALDGVYTVFNHLRLPGDQTIAAQADGLPLFDARRTTALWDDPQEILISADFTISLDGVPAGEYDLFTGFYRASDGVRLMGADGQNDVHIATITVP